MSVKGKGCSSGLVQRAGSPWWRYRGEIFTHDHKNPRMTIAALTSFTVNG